MKVAATVYEKEVAETRSKFFRLLEIDRNSPEFERLFREVDEELGRLSRAGVADDEAV